jgi:hypothetical protein
MVLWYIHFTHFCDFFVVTSDNKFADFLFVKLPFQNHIMFLKEYPSRLFLFFFFLNHLTRLIVTCDVWLGNCDSNAHEMKRIKIVV